MSQRLVQEAGVPEGDTIGLLRSYGRDVAGALQTSRILKPVPGGLPTVIYDEEYGAHLARSVGFIPYRTWFQDFAGVPALVIERYDRSPDAPQARLHQLRGRRSRAEPCQGSVCQRPLLDLGPLA